MPGGDNVPRRPPAVSKRCLGPVMPRHSFLTRDPVNDHVCPQCARQIKSLRFADGYVYSTRGSRKKRHVSKAT